jgi:hypothetical protein
MRQTHISLVTDHTALAFTTLGDLKQIYILYILFVLCHLSRQGQIKYCMLPKSVCRMCLFHNRRCTTCPVCDGRCDTNSNNSTGFVLLKVAMASKVFCVAKDIHATYIYLFGDTPYCTCLGHLGWCNRKRNPICCTSPKVARASTLLFVAKEINVCRMYLFSNRQCCTCLCQLRQHDTKIIISICIMPPRVDRASTILSAKEVHAQTYICLVTDNIVHAFNTLCNRTQI